MSSSIGISLILILEFMLVLCLLSLRVPALRRQGWSCSSGYFWRLGGCLFINRKETIKELEFREAERIKKETREEATETGLVSG